MPALFGPAGASDSFIQEGHKSSLEMCDYLSAMGLDAYEYQCNKGVKIGEKMAIKLGETAKTNNIRLSVHAPYYISLSSTEEEKRLKSIDYIIATLTAANNMGADRIVVHSGSCSNITRSKALELAKDTLFLAQKEADKLGLGHIHICPETMGKINQLGTLDEVIELCGIDERFIPTVDFGHLNARSFGGLKSTEDIEEIFDKIEDKLGLERLKMLHTHYSRIEFTEKGGEKKHWRYIDIEYGPDFEPIAEVIYKRNLSPVVICESQGTQAEDAKVLKDIYNSMFE